MTDVDPQSEAAQQQRVEDAISQAKTAAHRVGVSAEEVTRADGRREAYRAGRALTSFGFRLEGLGSALHVHEIEHALERIDGVEASIVYSSQSAWITAPDEVSPDQLIAVFADFGISAHLTRSSLARRADRLEVRKRRALQQDRRAHLNKLRTARLPRKRRRESVIQKEADAEARRSGRLREAGINRVHERSQTDVLFTARKLTTRARLVVSVLLTIPVLLLTAVPRLQFDNWQWVCLGLTTPVVTYGAWPFHRAAAGGFRRGMSALDAASSIAIGAAYLWSLAMLVFTHAGTASWRGETEWFALYRNRIEVGEVFFDVACGITVLLLWGRRHTRRNTADLMAGLLPVTGSKLDRVTVVRRRGDRREAVIPIAEVRVGDDIVIPTGRVVPCDGRVVGGSARISPGLVAGDEREQTVKVNQPIYAGAINLGDPLKIRVHRTGSQTRLAGIRRWVAEASSYQNWSAQLATRTASALVPWTLALAAIDFLGWWLISSNLNVAFTTALAMLACVCPVALAMSTNQATRLGLELAARHGILFRNAETIRAVDEVTTVMFNRVGTLSGESMRVETVTVVPGENPELVVRVAGALAMESNHPVSRALVRAAREARDADASGEEIPHWLEVTHPTVTENGDFRGLLEIPVPVSGRGEAELRQVDARLWRPRDLSELPGKLATAAASGGTPLVVSWRGAPRGVITLMDHVKDDADLAIEQIENLGVQTMMLSRDTYPVARRFADGLGISSVLAGIAPSKKTQAVRAVHTQGESVALVGDVSVLAALKVADVGVLMGAPDALDIPEADVVLLRSDVAVVPDMLRLSRRISALADQNILFAWGYNLVALSLSAAGVLHPMAATVLMLAASMIIEVRSSRARRF